MQRVALLVVLLAVGCTKRNPAVCCTTAEDCAAKGLPEGTNCADGLRCVQNECEAPQSCQAASDCEPPTPMCAPDGVCGECVDSSTCGDGVCDDVLHACRDCTSDDECATGFCSPATNRCAPGTITPRYLPTICDAPATTAMAISIAAIVDTSTDSECIGGIVDQAGAPDICVLHHSSITIAATGSLRATGTRALALVSDSDIEVAGTIDVSADADASGPGGSVRSGGSAASDGFGGGGAGFKTPGGAGGSNTVDGGAANGGTSRDAVASQVFLGGARSGVTAGGVPGGGGGGALIIVSCRGGVVVSGLIDASGGGGEGGQVVSPNPSTEPHGGAGGGSGGHVLLQGRRVSVLGQLFANGGGGGSGRPYLSPGETGNAGSDGLRSDSCAPGGFPTKAGAGGDGGCQEALPGIGEATQTDPIMDQVGSAAGGGGSVGFLRVAVPTGVPPELAPVLVSPLFEQVEALETH